MAKCRGMLKPLLMWYAKVSAKSLAVCFFLAKALPRQNEKLWICLGILLPMYLAPEFQRKVESKFIESRLST